MSSIKIIHRSPKSNLVYHTKTEKEPYYWKQQQEVNQKDEKSLVCCVNLWCAIPSGIPTLARPWPGASPWERQQICSRSSGYLDGSPVTTLSVCCYIHTLKGHNEDVWRAWLGGWVGGGGRGGGVREQSVKWNLKTLSCLLTRLCLLREARWDASVWQNVGVYFTSYCFPLSSRTWVDSFYPHPHPHSPCPSDCKKVF